MCQIDVQHSVKTVCSCTVAIASSTHSEKVCHWSFLGHHERTKMSHSRSGRWASAHEMIWIIIHLSEMYSVKWLPIIIIPPLCFPQPTMCSRFRPQWKGKGKPAWKLRLCIWRCVKQGRVWDVHMQRLLGLNTAVGCEETSEGLSHHRWKPDGGSEL